MKRANQAVTAPVVCRLQPQPPRSQRLPSSNALKAQRRFSHPNSPQKDRCHPKSEKPQQQPPPSPQTPTNTTK